MIIIVSVTLFYCGLAYGAFMAQAKIRGLEEEIFALRGQIYQINKNPGDIK